MQFSFGGNNYTNLGIGNSMLGKPRRNTFGVGVFMFLLLIGLSFTIVGVFMTKSMLERKDWPTTTGKVTNVSASYDADNRKLYTPTVEYTIDRQTYTAKSSTSSSSRPSIGSQQSVQYNPGDPSEGYTNDGMQWLSILVLAVGIITSIIAPLGYIRSRKRSGAINTLKQQGIKTQGVVTNIISMANQPNTASHTKVVVTAIDPTTQQPREFESDSMAGSIIGFANYQQQPVAIDVYIDSANPANYYVDIDELPSVSAENIQSLLAGVMSRAAPSVQAAESVTPTTTLTTPQAPVAPPVTNQPPNPVPPTDQQRQP